MKKPTILIFIGLTIFFFSCSNNSSKNKKEEKKKTFYVNPMKNKGIGPIDKIELGEINVALVENGKKIFNSKCIICHKIDAKYIGPSPKGILSRRTPEWIMNMMLNPKQMLQDDPIAKKLLIEYMAPMPSQGINKKQARELLEYFRTL